MRTQLSSGQQVRIVFKHTPPEPNPPDDGHPHRQQLMADLQKVRKRKSHWKATTECLLLEAQDGPPKPGEERKIIATGLAACSWKDQFVKEAGRLVALRRATADLATADREKVINAYINRPRSNKKSPSPTQ